MGCVSSKQTVSVTPALDHSGILREHNACNGSGCVRGSWSELESGRKRDDYDDDNNNNKYKGRSELGTEFGESGRASSNGESLSFRLGNLQKYVEGEHVAAGWPAWLSAVAGEAIQGWVPLRADAFEKLEKIGQGTYSSVFRARDLDTGKMVALKKVRFDNFEPESVRFMAREILILRRLDHPNIMKLEGIITSRLSCSIYLVFEYMEHDITGLLSCPDIKFSEAQVKCYMKQLLSGLDHCHSHGIMHRDIKGSNLLVNNEGILKIGDFGLANFLNARQRQPLTSRVVTLWYRPPELLLGSTDYDATVDLWSVGCVFAEILRGKPVLQGRTEVEQLHKIFKLCGSPPDDYWKKSRLPHATLFKPQQPYETSLLEFFKDSPKAVVNLISTFLSVEPHKRGTASSALASEYFRIRPFACEPSSLPVYPPNKEIDAKHREDAKRKKGSSRARGADAMRKQTRKPCGTNKLAPSETTILIQDFGTQLKATHNVEANGGHLQTLKEGNNLSARERRKLSSHLPENASHVKNSSQEDIPFSGPLPVSSSSGFAWAKRRKDSGPVRSHTRSISRGHIFNEPSAALQGRSNIDSRRHDSDNIPYGVRAHCRGHDSYEIMKCSLQKEWSKFERPDSFEASDEYHSQELSLAHYPKEDKVAKRNTLGYCEQLDKVEFSGPLLSQSHRVDELLERHERHIRQAVRKSWFLKAKKHGK